MECRVPAGFHDRLDSPLTRLVEQRLIDNGAPASTWTTNSPIKEITRKTYEGYLKVWFASTGLAEDEILALDHGERCTLVETSLAEKAETASNSYVLKLGNAINWWAGENNIDSPVTDVAKAIKGQGKGKGRAQILSSEELTALISGLKKCEVSTGQKTNPDTLVGWHLRTRAAILVTVTCSLRINSELPQLKNEHILSIDGEGISLRIPETKTGVRDIVISPRSDELCPIAAIEEFYQWLKQHNLERPDGLLLPKVSMNHMITSPDVLDGTSPEGSWWMKHVVPYMQGLGFDMANKSLHGLRSMAITEAVNAGWSHVDLRDLGGWQSLNVAAGYARNTGANIDLYGDGA